MSHSTSGSSTGELSSYFKTSKTLSTSGSSLIADQTVRIRAVILDTARTGSSQNQVIAISAGQTLYGVAAYTASPEKTLAALAAASSVEVVRTGSCAK